MDVTTPNTHSPTTPFPTPPGSRSGSRFHRSLVLLGRGRIHSHLIGMEIWNHRNQMSPERISGGRDAHMSFLPCTSWLQIWKCSLGQPVNPLHA